MYTRTLLIVIFSIPFMFFSCDKHCHDPEIRGKLVYRSCATIVVQVLDTKYHHMTQESWHRHESEPVLHNVFRVENNCTFNSKGIEVGDEFLFKVTSQGDDDCAVCMLWDNPPAVSQKIIPVKKR